MIAASQELRIEHVTIVSPESAVALNDVEVTVRNERIAAISPTSAVKPGSPRHSEGAVIDGRGLYLIPGLIDSHVHLGSITAACKNRSAAIRSCL